MLITLVSAAEEKDQKQPPEVRKGVLRNFTKCAGKHQCQGLLFNKVAGLRPETQLFSCEFCEITKNTFFTEHLRVTASEG